jgi:hypothetical protein
METKSELDELAARYLDLWERQLTARTGDADFEAQLQRWLALSSRQPQMPGEAADEASDE